MFVNRFKQIAFVLVALAAAPVALQAQEAAPADAQAQQQVAGWIAEMQQIHGKLEQLQMRALQDPALAAAQAAVGETMRAAMSDVDPTLDQTLARAQALEAEATAAQQAGDNARLQALGAEMQQIEQKFVMAQQAALQQPELATRVQSFQSQLEQKMTELDPQAEGLIARFQELETRLASVMQAQP